MVLQKVRTVYQYSKQSQKHVQPPDCIGYYLQLLWTKMDHLYLSIMQHTNYSSKGTCKIKRQHYRGCLVVIGESD